MKVSTETSKEITISEGERYATWTMNADWECKDFDTNMPYEKSSEDWEFYWKAIRRMLQELKAKI